MRVLILHVSAGTGHRRAAEALAAAFAVVEPEAAVTVSDLLEFTPSLFRETYANGYLRVVRAAPELWGYMYAVSDRKASIPWRRKVRSAFNAINTVSLRRFLKDQAPDVVVCTHFMPLEVMATRIFGRRARAPLYCVVTDYAVHALWLVQGVQAYYVATEFARQHLVRKGEEEGRVVVSGIPVAPEFGISQSPADARVKLGLDAGRATILVMCGGFGVGPAVELLEAFHGSVLPWQMLVVAGASEDMRRDCEEAAHGVGFPVKVFGFVSNVHELMDAADVVISKPGGLTASEVMAKGKPLMIVNPIPGQEQRNCEYLLEAGAATRLYEMEGAPYRLQALLGEPERLARLRENARAVGRPHAAVNIVQDILRRLPEDTKPL